MLPSSAYSTARARSGSRCPPPLSFLYASCAPLMTRNQGKADDAVKFLVHGGALLKPACTALASRQPRLCVSGMQVCTLLIRALACHSCCDTAHHAVVERLCTAAAALRRDSPAAQRCP